MQVFKNDVQSQTQFPKDPFILLSYTCLYVQGHVDTQTKLRIEMKTADNETISKLAFNFKIFLKLDLVDYNFPVILIFKQNYIFVLREKLNVF